MEWISHGTHVPAKWVSVKERLPKSQATFAGPVDYSIRDVVITGRFSQTSGAWMVGTCELKELGKNYWNYWLEFALPPPPEKQDS